MCNDVLPTEEGVKGWNPYIYRDRRLACGVLIKAIRLLSCYRSKYYLISSLLSTHGEWPFTTTIAHVLPLASYCSAGLLSHELLYRKYSPCTFQGNELPTRGIHLGRKSIEQSVRNFVLALRERVLLRYLWTENEIMNVENEQTTMIVNVKRFLWFWVDSLLTFTDFSHA